MDYEKDSEEEQLEADAESLSGSDGETEEELDSTDEAENKWIVPDGYFSTDEVSDPEDIQERDL